MAITSVNFRPKVWSSAYNPIMWAVASDKATQTDMKYVFDVYINAATGATAYTYRIKQRPNPSGYAQIDVSTLTQGYINLNSYYAEQPNINTIYTKLGIDEMPTVHVKVGEEYLVNGTLTLFNGLGVTGSNPNYFLSPYGATGYAVRALPAALDFNTQYSIMEATTTYNPFWSDYIMDGNGKFLSLEPGNRSIRLADTHTLTFLNQWDSLPTYGSYAYSILAMKVILYSANGTVLNNIDYYNTNANGGGPQTTNTYTSITESRTTDLLAFKCGPPTIGIFGTSVAYYTVTAYLKLSATTDPTASYVASETIRFDIDYECENLYKNVRLSWLNSLGGRDYYNFKMFYEKTTTSKGETYNQTPLNYSGITPLSTYRSIGLLKGGDKTFNKTVETKFQIQTDWLTQDYVDFLAGIPESSSVWAYIGDDNLTPYTIIIDNVDYTYKNVKQTKLVQATFTCRYTKTQVKQNL